MRNRRWPACSAFAAILIALGLSSSAATLRVTDVGEAYDARHVEFRGVGAGEFDPAIWQAGTLQLVPDIRHPLISPREGKFRNIYAPSIVEVVGGFRIYYGAWDGTPTGNDRIYLAETTDFLSFTNRRTLIEPGQFEHVCNVNVTPAGEGFAMMCTAFPDSRGRNKPVMFTSADGVTWKSPATPDDIIDITGYDQYANADINGMNVLLADKGKFHLYFCDFKNFGKVFRATSTGGRTFTFDGVVLDERLAVNDVKKFRVGQRDWYLMGLHMNTDRLFYSLSEDAMKFPPSRVLCERSDDADQYIVAIGWVTAGKQDDPHRRLLGALYGAGATPTLNANRIFARWLQKKVVVIKAGKKLEAKHAFGPDQQLFATDQAFVAKIELYAEDGKTALVSRDGVKLKPGRAYLLEVQP